MAALILGLALALRTNDAGPRVLAAGFLGYYLVVGASPLVFARYALPMALLQCVFAAAAPCSGWSGAPRRRNGPC